MEAVGLVRPRGTSVTHRFHVSSQNGDLAFTLAGGPKTTLLQVTRVGSPSEDIVNARLAVAEGHGGQAAPSQRLAYVDVRAQASLDA